MTTTSTTKTSKKQKLAGRLTTEFDKNRDREVREKLVTARIGLLLKAPFFGNLATRLELVNADSWCGTAATDGRKFYYNTEFVGKLKAKEVEFLFGHEVLHNVYDHLGRTGKERDPMLFNCAADYCVNNDLIQFGIGDRINPCLYDAKYKGWSAEEVYDDLYDKADKINLDDLLEQLVDDHLEGDSDSDKDGDGKESGSGRPRISAAERQAIKDEIREAVLQAAQATGAGNLPSGVARLIKSMTQPVVDWRELIQQQIASTVKNDFTWMRPSRKTWHMDAVMPGMKPGEQIDVAIGIDTSGSITESDVTAFMTEIQGIMSTYDEYRIQVWSFDTQVYNHAEYTSESLDDILDYEPVGGGGTDFMSNFDYMKDNNIQPKKFIMFTDGYPFGSWGDENYCDTVFIIKGNENVQPPFGVWAIYEHAGRRK